MTVTLDKNGHAMIDGVIRVYSFAPDTREYIGYADEYISAGIGLPASSTSLPPGNVPPGSVAVFINNAWQVLRDLRGQMAYSTVDRRAVIIDYLGELLPDFTLSVPGQFDMWDGSTWIPDTEEKSAADTEENRKNLTLLIAEASQIIAPLKDASDGGYIDDADKPKLTAWQKYRYALTKVDPAKPVWPEKPAE
ncbi:tail fiber assembly protein [Citrobacter freundii]|uniref:tail fiber assembly protein n=1 Tax=Citrobacter TaxID=544 RepID=UPI00257752B4|nr:tail fiber assembly protein [Citrobacter sp. Cf111]MDM3169406.1 tail fiber assembly protein [Citrobacter sp. Cf111]